MLEHLFRSGSDDPFRRAADDRAGAWSALVGIAANASMASGGPIRLDDIAGGVDRPDLELAPFGPGLQSRSFEASRYPFMTGARPLP